MATELRRFPSLESKRTTSSRHTRCQPSASSSLYSARSSLSRFPSLHSTSTRTSTITPVSTTTSPSLVSHDEELAESLDPCLYGHISPLEPADISLYEDIPLVDIDSFRILRVKPGCFGTPLDCELSATTFRRLKSHYSALSYTWDPETICVPVCVNGRMLDVPRSLVDFICTLRSPHRAMRIWVDVICINQQSCDEKTHQVRLMSRIYSNAACTQLWLGHDLPLLIGQMKLARMRNSSSDQKPASNGDMASEQALLELLTHRYWTHTWVIQDILLAKEVWVHCGHEALRWYDLIMMAQRLANSLHTPSVCYIHLLDDSNLMHLHGLRRNKRFRGLPELLTEYSNYGCENVQDRIFGLVGLVNDRNDPLSTDNIPEDSCQNRKAVIDYSLTLEQLFRRLMEMYDLLPAISFALPLWSALELDSCRSDSFDLSRRIRIQGFPCSMLMMPRLHRRIFTGSVSSTNPEDVTREELLCLSDPHSKAEVRQPRVCLSVRVKTNDFEMTGKYRADACLIELQGLALDYVGYDNLCRAFETTLVYRVQYSSNAEDVWAIDMSLTALKALHAIVNPPADQHLLNGLGKDTLDTDDIDDVINEWTMATTVSASSLSFDLESSPTPERAPETVSLAEPPQYSEEPKLPPRTRRRYRFLKRARLNGLYDWMVRPLYGDRLPAWT